MKESLAGAGSRRVFLGISGAGLAGLLGSAVPAQAVEATDVRDVKRFGAKGDGNSDDTEAIQSAINAAASAGSGVVFLPAGVYRTTASLRISTSQLAVCGVGGASTIRPVGDFDTIRFAPPGTSHIYRNAISDLFFDEAGKAGGRTLVGEYVAQFQGFRLGGAAGWSGWHFHNFNCVSLTECRFESYRGAYYGRASGGGAGKDKGRSDVLRLIGIVHGGARKDGITGIDVDGFVHTVNGWGIYLVAIGGRGLWARNSIGAENHPSFFTMDDFECDYPDLECIRLDAGEHFSFNNTQIHATRKNASNIHISPHVEGVTFTAGFCTGAQRAGIAVHGKDVILSGMTFHANSNHEFGGAKNRHPGVLLSKTCRDVTITGCRSGHAATEDYQSFGCEVEKGADNFVITGNNFRNNVRQGLNNLAGTGPSKVVANNI